MFTKLLENKIVIFISIFSLIAIGLMIYPEIDIFISSLFYHPSQRFWLEHSKVAVFTNTLVKYFIVMLVLGVGILQAWLFRGKKTILYLNVLYLTLTLIIGPAVTVNQLLKEHWGRARPSQIEEFGGSKQFTPALIISNNCMDNCSFASGHASMAFWITSLAFIAQTTKMRRQLFIFGVMAGLAMGFMRIIMGRHFLSDIVFAGIIVIAINYIIYKLFLKFNKFVPLNGIRLLSTQEEKRDF
ncbi:phosphatase PAP2 family protein [Rickettsiales endosymbiont of Stachyamoeba lipophora]|uniref:phosphatase PAP2 family protein n=1 Tax=Rickettsiales endosymbiont of Stachyamoeba lipophora TaxID=2486578 RepID=UPI0013DE0831|nr:phosphatase PAP2 family protein [Rickettsiales endosymbiont of Stachyamoeba lipophora]